MNKQEFIEAVLDQYPEWHNGQHVAKLRARGLVRLIEQAFDEGFRHAQDMRSESTASGFESMFPWLRK